MAAVNVKSTTPEAFLDPGNGERPVVVDERSADNSVGIWTPEEAPQRNVSSSPATTKEQNEQFVSVLEDVAKKDGTLVDVAAAAKLIDKLNSPKLDTSAVESEVNVAQTSDSAMDYVTEFQSLQNLFDYISDQISPNIGAKPNDETDDCLDELSVDLDFLNGLDDNFEINGVKLLDLMDTEGKLPLRTMMIAYLLKFPEDEISLIGRVEPIRAKEMLVWMGYDKNEDLKGSKGGFEGTPFSEFLVKIPRLTEQDKTDSFQAKLARISDGKIEPWLPGSWRDGDSYSPEEFDALKAKLLERLNDTGKIEPWLLEETLTARRSSTPEEAPQRKVSSSPTTTKEQSEQFVSVLEDVAQKENTSVDVAAAAKLIDKLDSLKLDTTTTAIQSNYNATAVEDEVDVAQKAHDQKFEALKAYDQNDMAFKADRY